MLYMSEHTFRNSEEMRTGSKALGQTLTFYWKQFVWQFNPIYVMLLPGLWAFFEFDSVKEHDGS